MTAKDRKKHIEGMKKLAREASSRESKDLLVKAGICTKKGNLRKPYR